jgi:hypothetical protein
MMIRLLRGLVLALGCLIALGCAAWSAGALGFDLPWASLRRPVAVGFLLALTILAWRVRGLWKKVAVVFGGCAIVLAWWLTLKPSNDRSWQPDVAQTAWAEIDGDRVTLHNVRNFDYRSESDYTPRWETRTVRLSQVTGIDIAVNYWGSPWMAHPIVSFQFADARPICFSIETRKELGESYSAVGGLYRQFELIYIAADERDAIRVRTNFRKGEDVYLYRTTIKPEQARKRFREYLLRINELNARPEWYNAVTSNCTTNIRTQRMAAERAPWDWRLLLNGYADELLYERGGLDRRLPFPELKHFAKINERARAASDAPDFSERIRTHLLTPSLRP